MLGDCHYILGHCIERLHRQQYRKASVKGTAGALRCCHGNKGLPQKKEDIYKAKS